MLYSYVMGMDESICTLETKGFSIGKDGDNYTATFSEDLASVWEEFIRKHLAVGYWNEYLGNNRVVFLFHLPDGIKRYEVSDCTAKCNFQNDEVLQLCEKLCNCKFQSLNQMLMDNWFYAQMLK